MRCGWPSSTSAARCAPPPSLLPRFACCAPTPGLGSSFFFQAEDGIRDRGVTGVQTCALPISLLLQLRRLTLGDGLELVLSCPACEEALGLDLLVRDLLVPPYEDWAPEHSVAVAGVSISFRLPTGGDLEAAARVGAVDAGRGASLVLDRCVLGVDGAGPAGLAPAAVEAVAARMAQLDPQAEIVLEMPCAVCGHVFSVPLDAGALLARELADRAEVLLQEIHLLALHYGWPESELLEMGTRRRRRYVAYLAEAVGR